MVDACASPAYHFHGVSTVFWVWLGLGIGALRPMHRRTGEPVGPPALGPTGWTVWTGAVAGGMVAAAGVLLWAFVLRTKGEAQPRGVLQVVATPDGPVVPGVSTLWTAKFTDGEGHPRRTLPGTAWQLQGDPATFSRAEMQLMRIPAPEQPHKKEDLDKSAEPARDKAEMSGYRLLLPLATSVTGQVTLQATYRDEYGRRYEAWSIKTIQSQPSR